MEKYREWADHATGINPFVPIKPKRTTLPFFTKLALWFSYLVGPILFILRIPFFCFLIPISFLRRPLEIYHSAVGCRLFLFLCGFFWIGSDKKSSPESSWNRSPRSGDIILSNHCSYLDIFYYSFRYAPTFAFPCPGNTDQVVKASLFGALGMSLFGRLPRRKSTLPQLLEASRRSRGGPVVYFAEGTTSNGRALLCFAAPLDRIFPDSFEAPPAAAPAGHSSARSLMSLDEELPAARGRPERQEALIFPVTLEYRYAFFAPTFPVGSPLGHFARLNGQVYNRLVVHRLAPLSPARPAVTLLAEPSADPNAATPAAHLTKWTRDLFSSSTPGTGALGGRPAGPSFRTRAEVVSGLRHMMAASVGVRPTQSLDMAAKAAFCRYWAGTHVGRAYQAQAQAVRASVAAASQEHDQ
ncbi:putative vacuolar protein sorting protein vps66 [Paratrimastix pyriformis]|uniref:Vacuolar protein sorting protein vps66 n=1 Tax=Paratrimastix pyriformis TaxID=342808 RepID=A0ABQ8UMA7_9EUKA|nr:putative vacuolar protein sorting protein vps66 [Paratrimastix pyriformis]